MIRPGSSPFSRRNVIAAIGVGVAALGAATLPALNRTWFRRDGRGMGSWWDRQSVALERAGLSEWSRHIGSEFRTRGESGTAALKLIAVKPLNSAGHRPDNVARDRAFVAVFDAGRATPKGDRLYAVNHQVSGDMSIFLSPAAGNGHIEAVFN